MGVWRSATNYNKLNGLLFISGLRGLMGNANRSSSVSVSAAAAAAGVPVPRTVSSDATPSAPASCGAWRPGNMAKEDTATSEAPGESDVICV